LSDPEVVEGDGVEAITDSDPVEEEVQRKRPWSSLLVVILLLLLTMCVVITMADIIVTRGPEQASFVARNLTCLQCHTELIPDFSKPVVHQPFALEECTVCHTPHGKQFSSVVTPASGFSSQRVRTLIQWLPLRVWFTAWEGLLGGSSTTYSSLATSGTANVMSQATQDTTVTASNLVMPSDQLCWTCHGSMGALLSDTYQHQPFTTGNCVSCHSPHASDNRALLTQAPNQLCFTCHPMGAQINLMQSHPPAKEGWCTDCHSPHASNNRGILVARQRDLCFRCHPTVAVKGDMPVQHQPFLQDNCTGCHEPHGSDNIPLLVEAQPGLCYRCHPAIQNQFAQASHHPVGVDLQCGSCHDPHAAQYRRLVNAQDNSFCYQCHAETQPLFGTSAHSPLLCIRCHTPHGSAYSPVLVAENPDLCLECHPALEGQNTHPVRQEFFDVHAKQGLTCSSSCHNPHGSKYEYMLKNFNYWQDGLCLQCHKYVGTYF
jgi:predicted CXXCH cytochrome family protein